MKKDGKLIPKVEQDPYQEDLFSFWQSIGKDLVRQSHSAVDESTRQILQINGMLISLFGVVFAFSDLLDLGLTTFQKILFLTPLACFLISLVFALSVFFLEKSPIHLHNHSGIKEFYQETLDSKLNMMKASAVSLTLGVTGMLLAAGVYLFGK